jgi:hypothetical protein
MVDADGYYHRNSEWSRQSVIKVKLPRCVLMHGKVIDAIKRTPISESRIQVCHENCKGCATDKYSTDYGGEFDVECLPGSEQVHVVIEAPGYPSDVFVRKIPESNTTTTQVFDMQHGVSVSMKIIDYDSRSPLPGAVIRSTNRYGTFTADENGEYNGEILPLRGGTEIALLVDAKAHCELTCSLDSKVLSEKPEVVLALPGYARFKGEVRDESGSAIEGAQVQIEDDQWWQFRRDVKHPNVVTGTPLDEFPIGWNFRVIETSGPIVTDAQGRFTSQWLVPWTPQYHVKVSRDGGVLFETQLGSVGKPGEYEIVLAPGH